MPSSRKKIAFQTGDTTLLKRGVVAGFFFNDGGEKMAKKKPLAERLSDYATDFSEMFSCDYSKLLTDDDAKPKEIEDDDKTVQVKKTVNKHAMRRVLSELALEKELPWHFEQGVSYHCISFGDVDALTYFRTVVKQQKIRYALISSWCIASEDIAEVRAWLERGYIGRVDWYVGEIFKASYYKQYQELIALCKELGGRVAITQK